MSKTLMFLSLYALIMTILAYAGKFLISKIFDIIFYVTDRIARNITDKMSGRYWFLLNEIFLILVSLAWILAPYFVSGNSFFERHNPKQYIVMLPCLLLIASIGNQLNTKSKGRQPSLIHYVLKYRKKYPISRTEIAIEQMLSFMGLLGFNIWVLSVLPVLPDAPLSLQYLLFSVIPISAAFWVYRNVKDEVGTNFRRIIIYVMLVIFNLVLGYKEFVQWMNNQEHIPKMSTDQWLIMLIFGLFVTFDRLFKVISDDIREYQKKNA